MTQEKGGLAGTTQEANFSLLITGDIVSLSLKIGLMEPGVGVRWHKEIQHRISLCSTAGTSGIVDQKLDSKKD